MDFLNALGTLVFDENNTTRSFDITILPDALEEADEVFEISFSATPSSGAVQVLNLQPILQAVIIDDATVASEIVISVDDVVVNEGDGTVTLNVSSSGVSTVPFTIDYSTLDNDAQRDLDFYFADGQLTFTGIENEVVSITLDIINDTEVEDNETFEFSISNPSIGNVAFSNSNASVTILDDDIASNTFVQIAFQNGVTVLEGEEYVVTFIATGTIDPGDEVILDYSILGLTAEQNVDFIADSGSIVFDTDNLIQTVSIEIVDVAM